MKQPKKLTIAEAAPLPVGLHQACSAATLQHQIATLQKQLRVRKKMERTGRVATTSWGLTIYNLRQAKLLSCSELAVKSGMSKGCVTMMETGKRPNPSLDAIIRIAAAFGMPASELVKAYEKTSPPNVES